MSLKTIKKSICKRLGRIKVVVYCWGKYRKMVRRLVYQRLNRVEVINYCLKLYPQKRYLEIGVRYGETIVSVEANTKVGVDPFLQLDKIEPNLKDKLTAARNINFVEKTSDDFFVENNQQFDVIFVDGLHRYEQAIKDVFNGLNCLSAGGLIVVHDCNPLNEEIAARSQGDKPWSGDVWKVIYDLKNNFKNINYFVLNTDAGLGVIYKQRLSDLFAVRYRADYIDLPYAVLANDRDNILNLRPSNYLFRFLNQKRRNQRFSNN